jgi:hypothetical protein
MYGNLSFTEQLCRAHDLTRGFSPADGAERATRDDVLEYIDAFSIDKRPDHPTSVIAWDLQRTFGESEGRRLLLRASRRWDAEPIRARDVVRTWWEDDYPPQAWVDEYLLDLIQGWRTERDRLQVCADAEKAWLAFDGLATREQLADWRTKFGSRYLSPENRLGPVATIAFERSTMPVPNSHLSVVQSLPRAPRYLFETVADLRKLPASKWLVTDWIPEQGVGLIYGEYASGKSFIGFDLLLHLAYGLPEWHGVKLPGEPCEVLLIAREGGKGFEGRVDAFKAHHTIADDTDRLVFMRSPANLGDLAQFEELKAAITDSGREFKMVMADTVGRALPGEDLYDPKSITGFMERLQQLGEIGNGVAIGVHHVNKGGDLFGSVYFGASSDFMFLVERDGNSKSDPLQTGKITCTKMKDGQDGWSKAIRYEKAASSLVVASLTHAEKVTGGATKMSDSQVNALRDLAAAIKQHGVNGTVTVDQWREAMWRSGTLKDGDKNPRATYARLRDALVKYDRVVETDGMVRLTSALAIPPAPRPMVNHPMGPPFPPRS